MSHLKVLMFGWEFPPFYSGGLGTACQGLTKGLTNNKTDVIFVMPHGPQGTKSESFELLIASDIKEYSLKIHHIDSILQPYHTEEQYHKDYEQLVQEITTNPKNNSKVLYGNNIYEEVLRLSRAARVLARMKKFDVIHCHDWMTFLAGIEAKKVSGKPLVVHVHITEFDKTGGTGINSQIYAVEKAGMDAADKIIAVSYFTKQKIIEHYGINPDKIQVVHNAVEFTSYPDSAFDIKKNEKVVLFLGRLTLQKGPDYFIEAAKKVLDYDPDVKFIIAGNGDMEKRLIDRVAQLGIGRNVLFAGFLSGKDVDLAYKSADLYVMPSVSEPFGITPLEALRNNVPVIISKQSGVSEVLKNALKVDFWDVDELANKIISVLNYRALHSDLTHHGAMEVRTFSWNNSAQKCIEVYKLLIHNQQLHHNKVVGV